MQTDLVHEAERSEKPAVESDFSRRKLKVAGAVLLGQSFATSFLPLGAFSILMIPLTTQFGWTRTEYSFAMTFIMIFGSISLWPIGRLADRVGVRPVILFGTAVVGVTTLAMSLMTGSLWQLYLAYALLGVFGSTGVAYMKVIAALFTQHRGKAMAILGAESMVAMAFLPLLINALFLNYGWRTMYVILGLIILAVVPVLFFFLEEPGGSKREKAAAPPPALQEGMTIWQALKDFSFWLIVLGAMSGFVAFGGMMAHKVPALIAKGFTQTQAVEMTTVVMLAGVIGNLAGGWAVDRFYTAKTAIPFSLAAALGAYLLLDVTAASGGIFVLSLAVGLVGFTFGAYRPMGTYFQTRYFGLRSFTEIMSVQFMIVNPVTAFAAPLFGSIFDRTQSYEVMFQFLIAAPLIGAVVWLLLPKYRYGGQS